MEWSVLLKLTWPSFNSACPIEQSADDAYLLQLNETGKVATWKALRKQWTLCKQVENVQMQRAYRAKELLQCLVIPLEVGSSKLGPLKDESVSLMWQTLINGVTQSPILSRAVLNDMSLFNAFARASQEVTWLTYYLALIHNALVSLASPSEVVDWASKMVPSDWLIHLYCHLTVQLDATLDKNSDQEDALIDLMFWRHVLINRLSSNLGGRALCFWWLKMAKMDADSVTAAPVVVLQTALIQDWLDCFRKEEKPEYCADNDNVSLLVLNIETFSEIIDSALTQSDEACLERTFIYADYVIPLLVHLLTHWQILSTAEGSSIRKRLVESTNLLSSLLKFFMHITSLKLKSNLKFESFRDLIMLIAHLVYEQQSAAKIVEQLSPMVMPTLLSWCQFDPERPLVREWALLSVAWLCQQSLTLQEQVKSLQPVGVTVDGQLTAAGITARLDEQGRIKVSSIK